MYLIAFVMLVVAMISWRGGTTEFLGEYDESGPFNYVTFIIDIHFDLLKALYLSATYRRLTPAVFIHAVSLAIMWAMIVTGPEWSK